MDQKQSDFYNMRRKSGEAQSHKSVSLSHHHHPLWNLIEQMYWKVPHSFTLQEEVAQINVCYL